MLLVWQVEKGAVVHEAVLDLSKRAVKLKPSDNFLLTLAWTPERSVVWRLTDGEAGERSLLKPAPSALH